jgi:hypothetical protein
MFKKLLSSPVFLGVILSCFIFGSIWLGLSQNSPVNFSGRAARAEAQRKTHAWSIDSPQGQIQVVDIISGTEFLRIITMPNGSTVTASGWVNSWDEEEIRHLAFDRK